MAGMSVAARQEYLAAVRVAIMSIQRPDAPPLSVPVWYSYEPGGDVLVQTGSDSRKFRLLSEAGGFSLTVQDDRPPYRYVSVSGPVTIGSSVPAADVEAMAVRYLDGEALAGYLGYIAEVPLVEVRMRPERWNSGDQSAG